MALPLDRHPADWESLLEQMIEATQEAIDDAVLHKKRHIVSEGQLELAPSDGSHYRFRLHDDWEPGATTRVQVELAPADPDQSIAGTILSTSNAGITLSTEVPLPDGVLKKAILVEAHVWLLQRLQDTLLRIQGQGEELARLGARLFGLLPRVPGRRGTRHLQIDIFIPNQEQARAIEVGMESEQILLIGPPGTGKTSVVCTLALEHLLAHKTVLLLAHTNGALDTAMRRLKQYAEQSGQHALIEAHEIVCYGKSTTLAGEAYQQMALQGIVDQHLGKLTDERDRLQQTSRHEQAQLAACSQTVIANQAYWAKERSDLSTRGEAARQQRIVFAQREQERITTLITRLAAVEEERKTRQQQQQRAVQYLSTLSLELSHALLNRTHAENTLQAARQKRETFQARSLAGRLFAQIGGTSEQSLLVEEQQRHATLMQAKLAVTALEQRHTVTSQNLATLECDLSLLLEEAQRLYLEQQHTSPDAQHIATFTRQIKQIEQAIERGDIQITEAEAERHHQQCVCDRLRARLNEIVNEQQSITEQVMAGARLIGTTLTELTTDTALRDLLVDAVLIDEASMASLVMVLVAATRARQHVALFGDPLQLRPVTHLTEKHTQRAAYWFGTDIFSSLRLSLEDADKDNKLVVMLIHQSHMHPVIAAPDSRFVYRGRVKNRLDPQYTPLQLAPHPEWPLMVIDTGDMDRGKEPGDQHMCRTQHPPRSSSKVNRYHVRCIVQLVRLLVMQIQPQATPQIGIVTPYGAQKVRIRQALQEHNLLQFVHVGTIHGMQYVQYPCVIFDTTEGYGVSIGQFTSNRWGHDGLPHDATRLLHVAHSRAQEKLIYLANVAFIYKDAYRREHLLTNFVHAAEEQGRMDSARLFSQEASFPSSSSSWS